MTVESPCAISSSGSNHFAVFAFSSARFPGEAGMFLLLLLLLLLYARAAGCMHS